MLEGAVTASSALAGGGPQMAALPNKPFTLDASFCGFKVLRDAPVNKTVMKILKMSD